MLEDLSPPGGPMRFFARCENVSFHPDGIDIICPDRDDDRSCRLNTKERSFDDLRLLAQPYRAGRGGAAPYCPTVNL